MPIYEYQCLTCGKRSELLQRMGDPPMAACPECGGAVKKLISSPAVQFKGSGWYVTDYGGKKGGPGGGGKSEGSGKGEGGGESKAAETSSSSSSESSGSTSSSETKAAKASE
jgi:putative FmdB family regulatory protein